MKFPKSVKIMGVNYHIRFSDDPQMPHNVDEFVYGYSDYSESIIVIHSGMSIQKTYETLVHEMTHCMLHEVDSDRCDDEKLVGPLGNVMYQVIKDNDLKVK